MSDEEEQQSMPIRRDVIEEQEPEITRYLLEAEKIIVNKMKKYRGLVLINDKVCQYPGFVPQMNEAGLSYVERSFNTFLNKNSILANLSSKEVEDQMIIFASNVRLNLVEKRTDYEIKSISTLREVKSDICDMARLVLSQSVDDKGRKFTHSGRITRESVNYTNNKTPRESLSW